MDENANDCPKSEERTDFEALRQVLQQSRAKLLQQIIAHPEACLSAAELDYRNPSLESSTVQYHLRKLEEVGGVEKLKLPKGERKRDLPSTFWAVTEKGRRLLQQAGLYEEIDHWRDLYERMERTPSIREIEAMPRPTPGSDR
ncbi:transcriptional regulator [Halobacteriales archaeon QS_1_68_20]|nr:MAG: transcriptional regulator [Halobacteriales archaeon QS_1_68_20]